jgi:hypothetical protein
MIKSAIPQAQAVVLPRPFRVPLSARQPFVDNTMRASLHTTAFTAAASWRARCSNAVNTSGRTFQARFARPSLGLDRI